jgi:taurine dioxygenase
VNPTYTVAIDGLPADESADVLTQLLKHCLRPDFTVRHRWRPGDLCVWDNRMTMHYAINDYDGHRRLMYRTTFAGERPV